jgi:hypothetical protein
VVCHHRDSQMEDQRGSREYSRRGIRPGPLLERNRLISALGSSQVYEAVLLQAFLHLSAGAVLAERCSELS